MSSRKATTSAFDTLMQGGAEVWSGKKKRKKGYDDGGGQPQKKCPPSCSVSLVGTTVPEVNINFHLDKCIVARASKESEQEHLKSQQKDETNKVDDEPKRTHLKSFETTRKEHPITPSPVNNVRPRSTQLTQGGDEETKTTGVGASRNAFSHLMEKSQKVFAGRRREWLHL
eukprot:CAMPEP_0194061556 /NCGR_PEP_ID=MMETSP0009_2-20130614/74972_1 /TAXON_ID=210454 /ORGANISM="Grammatophora oceanica, Strain CCMP 410" /LENGTH=170 /DNA_ID=CAMNT_0038712917 /DNA_START=135 /DNA_END=644 /DNA_ORIENTATION=-